MVLSRKGLARFLQPPFPQGYSRLPVSHLIFSCNLVSSVHAAHSKNVPSVSFLPSRVELSILHFLVLPPIIVSYGALYILLASIILVIIILIKIHATFVVGIIPKMIVLVIVVVISRLIRSLIIILWLVIIVSVIDIIVITIVPFIVIIKITLVAELIRVAVVSFIIVSVIICELRSRTSLILVKLFSIWNFKGTLLRFYTVRKLKKTDVWSYCVR